MSVGSARWAAGVALAALALDGSAGLAQAVAPEAGIQAVPATSVPPPVQTIPMPASPAIPQTSQGGRIASFPTADPPAPVNVPSATPLPGAAAANASIVPVDRAVSSVGPTRRIAGPSAPAKPAPAVVPTGGLDLVNAFDLGQQHDATFRAALAEHDANRQTADQTIAGYLPSASYNYQNIPTESGARHVISVVQPIVTLSGLATVRQRAPRRRYADATLKVRAQDLATRLMTAVTDIIRATEASTLNDARIDALKLQTDRADRLYKRGLGTVTDARDIQVRYEQSLANRVLLRSDRIAAQARLRSIVGVPIADTAFILPARLGAIALPPLETLLAAQETDNPAIAAARETERISKLESDRVRGSFLPTVGVNATYSRYQGRDASYVGVSVNAPLNGGTIFQAGAAKAGARRAFEERRQTQERAQTELSRLHALVDGGRQALDINAKAIEAAKLSVEANSKSYEGGVRTNVDVVNAIQTQFEVQSNYVQSAATLAANYLNLLLLSGEDPEDALAAVQQFLLAR